MIEEIKTFIEVVNFKNFTKAGKKINLSQPSVSLHIKRLEGYFDTTLIQRSNKSKEVIITPAGELVYDRGNEILGLIEKTKIDLYKLENKIKGKLTIGASLTIGNYLLPGMLAEFIKDFPELELEVIIENTHAIEEKVKSGEIHIGLVEGEICSSGIDVHSFYNDKLVLVASKDSLVANQDFEMYKLSGKTWISREDGSGTKEYLYKFLKENKIVPRNVIVFSSNYAVNEAIKNNLGITLVSEYVVRDSIKKGEVVVLPINPDIDINRSFSYIHSSNAKHTEVDRRFIEKIMLYKEN